MLYNFAYNIRCFLSIIIISILDSGPTHLFRSQIEKFSKRAVKDIERLFELSMGEKIVIQDNNNESVETDEIDESELSNILSEEEKSDIELEELLFDLGLLDDGKITTLTLTDNHYYYHYCILF